MSNAVDVGMRHVILLAITLALVRPTTAAAHCDALDGPVVIAATEALRTGDFSIIAIWVKSRQERELQVAFRQTLAVRKLGEDARALSDRYFFETAVRLHREGEGEPYTGLKPTHRDPAIAAADRALVINTSDVLVEAIVARVRSNLRERFRDVTTRAVYRRGDVDAGRAYVARYTAFIHYVAALYAATGAEPTRIDEPLRHEH